MAVKIYQPDEISIKK